MIQINNQTITAIRQNNNSISRIENNKVVLWTLANLISSCYASGKWLDNYPWTDNTSWKDQ